MKHTHKTKNITCRIVSKGIIMQVNTIDEILSPGQYKIDACGVTASDGFPDGVDGECLSAYLEVSDTNHSADNLKSAAVGQTLTYTDADGDTAVYHRSGTNKEGKVEWSAWSDTAALGLQNGSITSEKLSKDVRTKIDSPLRSLFIAAGAEYNDSGADKTKTAPWGETVTHKAGHYYLNGLGDITEEQMMEIFIQTYPFYNADDLTKAFRKQGGSRDKTTRTNLRNRNYFTGITSNSKICLESVCYGNETIESFAINYNQLEVAVTGAENSFYCSTSLKSIIGYLNIQSLKSIEFKNCNKLSHFTLCKLNSNISFAESKDVTTNSILFIINNAKTSSTITITLHPETYARLAGDADIVSALEAQPLISLVSS